MRKIRGLTINEVLIAIGLLLLTSALVVSVIGAVRRRMDETTCASHFSKLYHAFMIYRQDMGADNKIVGDLYSLGAPPLWINKETGNPLFGTFEDWKCPAPKRPIWAGQEYRPHYEYYLADAQLGGPPDYVVSVTSRYRDRTPLLYDINHNDHAMVEMAAPRVRKRILLVDLSGAFHAKFTTKQWGPLFYSIDFFEIED